MKGKHAPCSKGLITLIIGLTVSPCNALFYFMATHKFVLTNGGYFYRWYPKMSQPAPRLNKREQSEYDPPVTGPAEEIQRAFISFSGLFDSKYNDKHGLCVRFVSRGTFTIHDHCTGIIENRELESYIEITVPGDFYDYPFETGMPYHITAHNILPL